MKHLTRILINEVDYITTWEWITGDHLNGKLHISFHDIGRDDMEHIKDLLDEIVKIMEKIGTEVTQAFVTKDALVLEWNSGD